MLTPSTIKPPQTLYEYQQAKSDRNREVAPEIRQIGDKTGIITNHADMYAIFEYLASIAQSRQPFLITGETGVGKELIAKAIHITSGARGRMVTVNAAGLDDNVFSDTLFGHVKGAFTGAERPRAGLIEKANYGTLFLDEIGDLTPASQVKLLRLLQEGEYMPLGQDDPKYSNARIVTATNMDLWGLQRAGQFRKDLNFRIRIHHANVPPLRERMVDLPLLADHFLEKAAQALNKKKPTPPKELIQLLSSYSFPGNIRELETMIFDAVSRHTAKTLSLKTFQQYIDSRRTPYAEEPLAWDTAQAVAFGQELPTIKQATELLVSEALRRADGNQTVAAKMLGISRQALGKRIKNRTADA